MKDEFFRLSPPFFILHPSSLILYTAAGSRKKRINVKIIILKSNHSDQCSM
jgi:hypothetical protein